MFDTYDVPRARSIDEAVKVAENLRKEVPSGERGIIPEAYFTGIIYGLKQAKKIFETYCEGN